MYALPNNGTPHSFQSGLSPSPLPSLSPLLSSLSLMVVPLGTHLILTGLDDIFQRLDLLGCFCLDGLFWTTMRDAMRENIFVLSRGYMNMSEKARTMFLLPDSLLHGSWHRGRGRNNGARMRRLMGVMWGHLGGGAPTGVKFMEGFGGLCGSGLTSHWIDIVRIVCRRISHSWHQDTARCLGGTQGWCCRVSQGRTVTMGEACLTTL
jgi:hypothetical protein